MTALYQAVEAATAASGSSSVTVNKPTGTTSGDLLLLLLSDGGTGTSFTATGWSDPGATNQGTKAFYRVADGSEGASFTFTRGGSTGVFVGSVVRISAQSTGTPVQSVVCRSTGTSTTSTPGSSSGVTAAGSDSLLFEMFNMHDAGASRSATPPSGVTERYDAPTSGTLRYVFGGDRVIGAGSPAQDDWSWSGGAQQWRSATWVINPDSPAPQSISGTVAAVSGSSGAVTVLASNSISGTVAAVSGSSGAVTVVGAADLDGGVGFAEELPDDDLPPAEVPDPRRILRTVAFSVPPIELDDRGQPTAAWKAGAAKFEGTFGAYELFVGGQNVTMFRDLPVQIGTRQHADPFGYAALEVTIPGVTPWETPLWGTGDLSWMSDWAPVVLRLVDEAGVSSVLWRGFVGSVSPEAAGLRLTCAGEARGRLDFDKKTVRPFMFRKDVGVMLYDLARRPGLRITPTLGIETGIVLDERSRAQGTLLECIDEICSLSQRTDGETVTFTPTGPNGNIYEMHYRDSETVHYTVFAGAYGIEASLQSNLVDRPTTLYGVGRESDGGVWANLKAPGLFEAAPPPFPGTLSPGDVGEDVNTLKTRLEGMGYLDRQDAHDEVGFGAAMQDAVEELQDDFGHAQTGVVDEATWNAAYDIDITGPSLAQAHQEPLAELTATKRFLTTASGAIIGPNPDHVPARPKVTEMTDYGVYQKRQARKRARRRRQRLAQNKAWAGTLRLGSDLFVGDYHHGDPDPVIESRFAALAGKNIMLRGWDGDVLLQVAGDDKGDTGATLSVSTMGLPLLEVRQIIERNQEGRQNPAKTFKRQHRGVELGGIGEWWSEIGGEITVHQTLQGGKWNVLDPVIAGDMGTLAKVALELDTAAEFACALFAVPVNDGWVNNNLPNPFDTVGRLRNLRITHKGTGYEHAPDVSFSGGGGSGAAAVAHVSGGHVVGIEWTSRGSGYTSAPSVSLSGGGGSGAEAAVGIGGIGAKAWASDEVRDMADRRRILLGAWGDAEDPCGYGPNGHKADNDDLDGTFADAAGIPYRTFASDDINNGKRCALYWAVYVKTDNAIRPQRSLWPNPEVGM